MCTRNLKPLTFRGVPVQVWPRAPFNTLLSLLNPSLSHIVGSLAQSVEQRTFNPLVEGSNPSRPTNQFSLLIIKISYLNLLLVLCLAS